MISKELADPFGLFFKYLKNFFSTIVLSRLIKNDITNPKTIKLPLLGLRVRGKRKAQVDWPGLFG
jgi:hypothetical protein